MPDITYQTPTAPCSTSLSSPAGSTAPWSCAGTWRMRIKMILTWSNRDRHLSISESLLALLDYPHQLIVERVGDGGLILYQAGDPRISPDSKARKVNYPRRAMPRLSIGEAAAIALGLVEGRYQARIESGAIVAWRESGPS